MVQPLPPPDVAALAAAQAASQAQITEQTLVLLAGLWATVTDETDDGQLSAFIDAAAGLMRGSELAVGQVTETYLRQVLEQLHVPMPARPLVALSDSVRQGVPLEEVLARPAATVRYLRSVDTPPDAAAAAGAARLRTIGQTNLELAQRQAAVDVLSAAPTSLVRGYRRILRPYLSEGGACGLCVAAADRIYRVAELMPIHAKCKCSVMPVTKRSDPGIRLNVEDLRQLYADAGGTSAAKLTRARYRVAEHGELGPVLVRQDHGFRSAEEAAADLKTRRRNRRAERTSELQSSHRTQLATFEESIPDLERRARSGEDVAAALAWQRARVEELRRLVHKGAA